MADTLLSMFAFGFVVFVAILVVAIMIIVLGGMNDH